MAVLLGSVGVHAATSSDTVFITLDVPPYIEIAVVSSKTVTMPPTWTFVDKFTYEGWKQLTNVLVSEKVRVNDHIQVRSNLQAWHINAAVINKDHYSLAGVKVLVGLKAVGLKDGNFLERGMMLLPEDTAGVTLFNRWWNGTGVTRFDAEYQAVVELATGASEPPHGTITILYTVTSQ